MSTITFTGLQASTPLGAMAACGLLRVCSHLDLPGPVRLGWRQVSDWVAELTFTDSVDEATLIDALLLHMRGRAEAPELQWQPDIKMPADTFASFAREVQSQSRPDRRDTADFLAAFGSELVLARSKPEVKPTAFHMTAGQQKFLAMARELARSLDPGDASAHQEKVKKAFREALFGPWQYHDPQHSLGWDPATERLHALRAKSPTKEKSVGVAGAIWLAFEALPLFPAVAMGRRLVTGGFDLQGRNFSWPVWKTPLILDEVRSLLRLADLFEEQPMAEKLRARGICRVYRARRVELGDKGYAIFRAADLVV